MVSKHTCAWVLGGAMPCMRLQELLDALPTRKEREGLAAQQARTVAHPHRAKFTTILDISRQSSSA